MTAGRITVLHVTTYRYDHPVTLSPHEVRLHPLGRVADRVQRYGLRVAPSRRIEWFEDLYGNRTARITFDAPAAELVVDVALEWDLSAADPFDFTVAAHAARFPFAYTDDERVALAPYLAAQSLGKAGTAWMARELQPDLTGEVWTIDWLVRVNRLLHRAVAYAQREEPGVQSGEVTLARREGSCRDTGWLAVQLLRHHGIAARFVSGYLVQRSDGTPGGATGTAGGATGTPGAALHAWCEAYLPGAGWIGMDPTSGLLTAECHIPLAGSPSPLGAAPIVGATAPVHATMTARMTATFPPEADRGPAVGPPARPPAAPDAHQSGQQ